MITVRLKFTSPYKESFWFVSLGDQWPDNPELYLIRRTTSIKQRAKVFKDAEDAAKTMEMFGSTPGWAIDIEDDSIKP